jgi:glycosyltransferase involved in cell wall biosynthesis
VIQKATKHMKRRKIGINLLSLGSSQITGTGRFLKQLLEHLPPIENAEFVFFCQRTFDLEGYFKIPPGICYRRVNCPAFGSQFARVAYEQFVMPFKAQGLQVLLSPCVANPVIHPGFRTITTIHDLTPFFVRGKYGIVQQSYVRVISRILALTSSHIITSSENSRTDLVQRLRIKRSKIDVIYHSFNLKDLSTASFGDYFLFVGTLQPAKNLAGTIRAFALFSRKYDKAHHRLVIVGANGWGHDDCDRLTHELGIESQVVFAGYVSDEELDRLYAGCKGLILMSLYEGFGIPPLEALSWNKPSIVSNLSSLPEVVGRTGIQVAPTNYEEAAKAIRDIAEAPGRYLEGRDEQLVKFAPELQAEKFRRILEAR